MPPTRTYQPSIAAKLATGFMNLPQQLNDDMQRKMYPQRPAPGLGLTPVGLHQPGGPSGLQTMELRPGPDGKIAPPWSNMQQYASGENGGPRMAISAPPRPAMPSGPNLSMGRDMPPAPQPNAFAPSGGINPALANIGVGATAAALSAGQNMPGYLQVPRPAPQVQVHPRIDDAFRRATIGSPDSQAHLQPQPGAQPTQAIAAPPRPYAEPSPEQVEAARGQLADYGRQKAQSQTPMGQLQQAQSLNQQAIALPGNVGGGPGGALDYDTSRVIALTRQANEMQNTDAAVNALGRGDTSYTGIDGRQMGVTTPRTAGQRSGGVAGIIRRPGSDGPITYPVGAGAPQAGYGLPARAATGGPASDYMTSDRLRQLAEAGNAQAQAALSSRSGPMATKPMDAQGNPISAQGNAELSIAAIERSTMSPEAKARALSRLRGNLDTAYPTPKGQYLTANGTGGAPVAGPGNALVTDEHIARTAQGLSQQQYESQQYGRKQFEQGRTDALGEAERNRQRDVTVAGAAASGARRYADPAQQMRVDVLTKQLENIAKQKAALLESGNQYDAGNTWTGREAGYSKQFKDLLDAEAALQSQLNGVMGGGQPQEGGGGGAPMPTTKESLVAGTVYQTKNGPARWDGQKFIVD